MPLSFIGDDPFTAASRVRIRDDRADDGQGFQRVLVNLDGDTAAEVTILVDTRGFTLAASDFLL